MKTTNLLLSLAVGVSLQANAIDILDHESIPSYYATVEKTVDETSGAENYIVTYKQDARAWRAAALDSILRSYGTELMPEIAGNLPGDFASVVQVEEQADEMLAQQAAVTDVEYEINFGIDGVAWRPDALHDIFSAYNLVPDLDNFDDVPSGYGKVEEVQTVVVNEQTGEETSQTTRELKLGSSATLWRAGMLHKILSGYKKGDPSSITNT